ncbi:MAG: threonine synthase [Desulfarculaceae bacterium]|nr:threonine synthase [Desulfarculaceae bacterium]MCF8072059.1 threonine synthase [Desulfarculaceae bacterium]MCF8101576.1 threonine synthase [Desulfarculaceae bacterium]MCF8115126.1 threonine synthase [Desulfarculaceae bacterium]
MRPEDFSPSDQEHLLPSPGGDMAYRCLDCGAEHPISELLYTCPECGEVLLLVDRAFDRLKEIPGDRWRRILDLRRMLNLPALKGIFRYAELMAPVIPLDSVLYLGEGHTPMVEASALLKDAVKANFCFKNDGQNPSASFKDRGMAVALSYINYLVKHQDAGQILSVCASTGDTSAAAALYAAYLAPEVKSAVLLPRGKVTPQQLSQPLGAGAQVFEIPGVFDDCMKVVEHLADNYQVALLNSKNAWRILGQESYSYEVAQDLDWDLEGRVVLVPIGNAGNISAIMSGFMKLMDLGIISSLPKVVGVQSHHADPVFRYYSEKDPGKRVWRPVTVQASVAQAAMIGNPVSMPRVVALARRYEEMAGGERVFVVQVSEQEIMDHMILANRHGHVVCTQGGESLAGLLRAMDSGVVGKDEQAICDATAHHLKFAGFQQMYFEDAFPADYGVKPRPELVNLPSEVAMLAEDKLPAPGKPLEPEAFGEFVEATAGEIANRLGLERR